MSVQSRSVMVVASDPEILSRIEPTFAEHDYYTELVPQTGEALELTRSLSYDVILISCPLTDATITTVVRGARSLESASREATLIVLADDEAALEAEGLLGRGVNRILSPNAEAAEIVAAVSAIVHAAPRLTIRVITRITVKRDGRVGVVLCQTENISTTGMLLRTDLVLPTGTEIQFELSMHGEPTPIRGVATVTRRTLQHRERVAGLGTRFVSFEADDEKRLLARIRHLASTHHALGAT